MDNGSHPEGCKCIICTEQDMYKGGIRTLWRAIMRPREDRAPKLLERQQDKYVCPSCLEETLMYSEAERLFLCRNEKCNQEFALARMK